MRHVPIHSSSQSVILISKRASAPTFIAGYRRLFSDSQHEVAPPARPALGKCAFLASAKGPSTYHERKNKVLKVLKAQRSAATPGARTKAGISSSYLKMRSYIQFITTPTADTPGTALLLHFDDKRYVIGNIHEGLQRAGLQIGTRFLKAKDFFITGRTEWRTTGGLMGMVLTLADAAMASTASKAESLKLKLERRKAREEEESKRRKKPSKKASSGSLQQAATKGSELVEEDPTVTLHGGANLTHTLATARSFIFRKGTPIKVNEHHKEGELDDTQRGWEPTWADNRVQVWAMPIAPSTNNASATDFRPEPLKRSLGEFMTGEPPTPAEIADQWSIHPSAPADQAERDQEVREFAVKEMFGSAWRFDNLVETPLHEVKLPAGMFVRNPETKKLERYTGPVPGGPTPAPNISVFVRQPWPGALIDHLPPTKSSNVAMSYIIRNHRQRGKFRPAAAKELKVPPGPLWAALAAGSEVQSSDGEIITPDMVLEPGKEGGGVAVVDLPLNDYVESLVNRPEWSAEKVMTGIGAVVWILGPSVIHDPNLLAFIDKHSQLKHIVSSPDQCPNYLSMTSAAASAIRHNLIDPIRFPIPVHSNALSSQVEEARYGLERPSDKYLTARRGLKLQLEPRFEIVDKDVFPYLNTALVVQEAPSDVLKLGQAAQQDIHSTAVQNETAGQGLPSEDAEIICLGTGSALPSQHRNVSATLLRVPGCGSYLLDCGENTLGQLKRVYTEEQLAEVLQDLKLIWISHLHADHHLGTTSVIKAWYEEVHGKDPVKRPRPSLTEALLAPEKFLEEGKRLFIVGTPNMMRWLEEYSTVEDYGYNQLVPLTSSLTNWKKSEACSLEWNGLDVGFKTSKDSRVKSAIRKATGLSNLVPVSVNHCWGAQAVSLTFPTGFKFSYSGDCRPSRDFATIGKGTTVLLHEATFDDELKDDALAKKHSTTSEAIGVGMAMGAKRVLLTHFSQRYQKIPSMNSMSSTNVRLEDADPNEDTDQPIEGVESTVEERAHTNNLSKGSSETTARQEAEDHAQSQPTQPTSPLSTPFTSIMSTASLMRPPPMPTPTDMKIGVAFDYMRVRVRDIMHLEKFNPAMRELYKEAEEDEKAKQAAKEAFSDNEEDEDVVGERVEGKRKSKEMEERAEKARKGQVKAAKRKKENREKWERERIGKANGAAMVERQDFAMEEAGVPEVQGPLEGEGEEEGQKAVH